MAEWRAFQPPVPEAVTNAADKFSSILKKFRTVLNLILTVLETAKMFLIDLGNPLKVILEAIVDFVVGILDDLNQAFGIFFLPVAPIVQGQNFADMKGGIEHFNRKVYAAFYDTADANRPQFSDNADMAGFAIVLDSGNLAEILELIIRFFIMIGESITQNLPAPDNVVTIPITEEKEPITSGLAHLQKEAKWIKLKWSVAAPGGGSMADYFIPPKWRIERHSTKTGEPLLVDEQTFNAAGEKVTIKKQVVDPSGRPIYIWDHIEDIDPKDGAFWAGYGTGTYMYIDKTVEKGKTYFYRVRSIMADPPTSVSTSDVVDGILYIAGLQGVPCTPVEGVLPEKPDGVAEGDPVAALGDTILAALILGFHVPYKTAPQFSGHGSFYTVYPWLYDYLSTPSPSFNFYEVRIYYSVMLAEQMASSLVRSKDMFQSFWDAYKENDDAVEEVIKYVGSELTHPYLDVDVGKPIDELRDAIYSITLNLTGAMATRGDPPNWMALRVSNLIPAEVFGMIRKLEAEARGLLEAYEGIVKDIITFIELLEARIGALSDFISFLESIIQILANLSFPGIYTLLVDLQGGGIPGFLDAYMSATNGPEPGSDNYTMGVILVWGMPGLATFFGLFQGD